MIGKIRKSQEPQAESRAEGADRAARVTKLTNGVSVAAFLIIPTALHLRAMNMLFEGLKEKGAMIIVPSSAVDTMNLGGIMGMASFGQEPAEPASPHEGKAGS